MPWAYLAPIALLVCSNVFMTFAWVSRGLPQANEMVRRTISSTERREHERAAARVTLRPLPTLTLGNSERSRGKSMT